MFPPTENLPECLSMCGLCSTPVSFRVKDRVKSLRWMWFGEPNCSCLYMILSVHF
uniref:Uncharacterized protein n=1 Tax=Anguilla anguilla TaxID=7936 RepID=A0A0E9XBG7_ANGAN